jgi:hypothetical protein
MKKYKDGDNGKCIVTSVNNKAIVIEIPISTLVTAFNYLEANADGTVVKRGKRQVFAELVAEHLHDEIDQETGASYITDMLDKLFVDFGEGHIDTADIIKFPEEE